MPKKYYYIDVDSQVKGPFWASQMRRYLRDGSITDDTPLRDEESSDWEPAHTFPEISADEDEQREALKTKKPHSFSMLMWSVLLFTAFFMWATYYYLFHVLK
jgi:hypothetical protein